MHSLERRFSEIGRREAMKLVGCAALLGIEGCTRRTASTILESSQEIADQTQTPHVLEQKALGDVLKALDGVGQVDHVVATPNPVHSIAHIGQSHMLPLQYAYYTQYHVPALIEECQSNIYKIVRNASAQDLAMSLFAEGWTEESTLETHRVHPTLLERAHFEKKLSFTQELVSKIQSQLWQGGMPRRIHPDDYFILELSKHELKALEQIQRATSEMSDQQFRQYMQNYQEELQRSGDAVYRLARENSTNVFHAESKEIMDRASALIQERGVEILGDSLMSNAVLYDERESFAFQRIRSEYYASPDRTLSFLVFGRAHELADDVQAWNASHPEETYDLYKITPIGDSVSQ